MLKEYFIHHNIIRKIIFINVNTGEIIILKWVGTVAIKENTYTKIYD